MKKLGGRLEHVPPRTRGDFRGVTGNPHQILIPQWIPPSSPPLERGDDPRATSFCKDSQFFHSFRRKKASTFRGGSFPCGTTDPDTPPVEGNPIFMLNGAAEGGIGNSCVDKFPPPGISRSRKYLGMFILLFSSGPHFSSALKETEGVFVN